MAVVDITSKSQFDQLRQSKPTVAIQAHASWCGPCKAIGPVFEKLAAANQDQETTTFARFDTDEVPDVTQELGVTSIPAFFFFKDGSLADKMQGANPPVLEKHVEELVRLGKE